LAISPYLFAALRYRSALLAASSCIAPTPHPNESPIKRVAAELGDPVCDRGWRSGVFAATV
jgi:hypothetical protein